MPRIVFGKQQSARLLVASNHGLLELRQQIGRSSERGIRESPATPLSVLRALKLGGWFAPRISASPQDGIRRCPPKVRMVGSHHDRTNALNRGF